MMKRLLIKLFVGDYTPKIGNRRLSFPRASTIIMPLMIICGWYSLDNFPLYNTTLGVVLLSLLVLSLYLGFIHFWIFKPKWEELTDNQKWQLGAMSWSKGTLTDQQLEEWGKINESIISSQSSNTEIKN